MATTPDAQIAQRLIAVERVKVDAPVQPVARQEVLEERGACEFAVRHHLAHRGGVSPGLQRESDRVVVLEPALVSREIGRLHVQPDALAEDPALLVPDVRCEVIGAQQVEQGQSRALTNLSLGQVLGQAGEHPRQRLPLSRRHMHAGLLPRRTHGGSGWYAPVRCVRAG
jgi:hypothetical protein